MSALALIVAATLAQAGALRSDLALRGGGAGRSVVALSAWDKGGSQDWGAGIPSPTIDCAAVGTSASASLQCSGATPSFAGPGQTAAGSPWWYRGDSAVRPAIALNGSTDWWGLGDVADVSSRFAICVSDSTSSTSAAYAVLASRYTANRGWWLARYAGTIRLYVCDGTDCSGSTQATIAADQHNTLCAGYEYSGTPGTTSVLRANINGTALADVTNARGPAVSAATAALIGARSDGLPWAGSVRRVAIWTGADAPTSAAQLAQLVATQWGLAADKPSGTVATHARTDSTPCGPFSDSEMYWLGPGAPCIHAPTYQGWASGGAVAGGIEVYGAGANRVVNSSVAAWTASGTASTEAASASCPLGPTGVRMDLVNVPANNDGVYSYQTGLAAGSPDTVSAWVAKATGDADCTARLELVWVSATGINFTATETPARVWVSGACDGSGRCGPYLRRVTGTTCARFCAWSGQGTATAYPVPYRSTTGTAYSGLASTATTLTIPVSLTDPSRWAIAWTGSAADWTPSANVGLWGIGVGGSANTALGAILSGGNPVVDTYDAAVGYRRGASTQAFVDGTQHAILMGVNGSTHTTSLDGAAAATTMTGTGTGIAALPSTLYVGAFSTTTQINGLVSRVAQCRRASGCR